MTYVLLYCVWSLCLKLGQAQYKECITIISQSSFFWYFRAISLSFRLRVGQNIALQVWPAVLLGFLTLISAFPVNSTSFVPNSLPSQSDVRRESESDFYLCVFMNCVLPRYVLGGWLCAKYREPSSGVTGKASLDSVRDKGSNCLFWEIKSTRLLSLTRLLTLLLLSKSLGVQIG